MLEQRVLYVFDDALPPSNKSRERNRK